MSDSAMIIAKLKELTKVGDQLGDKRFERKWMKTYRKLNAE